MTDDDERDFRAAVDETAEEQAPQAAGPVAEDDPRPRRLRARSRPPRHPRQRRRGPAAEEPAARTSRRGGRRRSDEAAELAAAEEPAGEEAEAAAEEEAPQRPCRGAARSRKEKKKDVIPGADLEPIAVEPEEPQLSAEEQARLEAEEEEQARREAALAGDADEETERRRVARPAKMESDARFLATGKRKSSIARVTLLPGDGKFEINKRSARGVLPAAPAPDDGRAAADRHPATRATSTSASASTAAASAARPAPSATASPGR